MKEPSTVNHPYVLLKPKSGSFSVSINWLTIYSFDLEGRLIGAYQAGVNYKRGFDNSLLRKWSETIDGQRRRQRRKLTTEERRNFFQEMTAELADIAEHPDRYRIETPEDEALTWELFQRCLKYDWSALEASAARFSDIYKPVTILPPDQYYSLVLQVTEGCSYNKCTFCNFYRDRHFRIKSVAELQKHITQVKSFFGRGLHLRQSLFLADANALIMPQQRLLEMLRLINAEFGIHPSSRAGKQKQNKDHFYKGIFSFIDLFTGEYKSAAAFREMAELGVTRAYIGMESGSQPLLEFLKKPGSKQELVEAVNKVKSGGMDVGVIVLMGAGGREYSDQHISDTTEALNQMHLDENDFIYLSDFIPQENTTYEEVARIQKITPLLYRDIRNQEEAIREKLIYQGHGRGPRIARYDIREFLY